MNKQYRNKNWCYSWWYYIK